MLISFGCVIKKPEFPRAFNLVAGSGFEPETSGL